jgi:hypothetical protein
VLCASLLENLEKRQIPRFYYFCRPGGSDKCSDIMKALALQIIMNNTDLIAMVYTNYVLENPQPSLKTLRAMMFGTTYSPAILHAMDTCRIIVDGIDECDEKEQPLVIKELRQIVSAKASHNCKLLLCSRAAPTISKALKQKSGRFAEISLSTENINVDTAIRTFVERQFQSIEDEHILHKLDSGEKGDISEIIAEKANGRCNSRQISL